MGEGQEGLGGRGGSEVKGESGRGGKVRGVGEGWGVAKKESGLKGELDE